MGTTDVTEAMGGVKPVQDDLSKLEVLEGDWLDTATADKTIAGDLVALHEDGRSVVVDGANVVRYYDKDKAMVHEDTDADVVALVEEAAAL